MGGGWGVGDLRVPRTLKLFDVVVRVRNGVVSDRIQDRR